jgi:putative transposase
MPEFGTFVEYIILKVFSTTLLIKKSPSWRMDVRMPRLARRLTSGYVYHVINRCSRGQEVFHDELDYLSFFDLMREAAGLYSVKVFAYCLMPDHFHLLVLPGRGEELSKLMQWLMTRHVRCHHRRHGTSGRVWQGRFMSFIVQMDDHLLNVARFVESNPVRSGLAESSEEWMWSSHRENIGAMSRLLTYGMPIEFPESRETIVTHLPDSDIARIRQSISRQSPYGSPDWQEQTCRMFGLESTMRRRGRPRKNDEEK